MPENISRFIFDAIETLETPVALLSLGGKVRYANDACWLHIFDVVDSESRIPDLDYLALAFVGVQADAARRQLEPVFGGKTPTAEAEARIAGSTWRICLSRFDASGAQGVLAWHWRAR